MTALKGIGGFLAAIAGFIVISLLIGLLIKGATAVLAFIYPTVATISGIALIVSIFILLPLGFLRATRPAAATGLIIASYVFGFSVWIFGFLITMINWGVIGLLVGFMLAGIGVIPVAMLSSAIGGHWDPVGQLAIGIVVTFAARGLGTYFLHRHDQQERSLAGY